MDQNRRRLVLVFVSLALSCALSVRAQSNIWLPITPGNGFSTTAIAVDPDSSSTVFLGTDKGEILRSRDAGASWTRVHLEPGSFAVSAIAIAPSPAATVYAVFTHSAFEGVNFVSWSRVLRSVDGGTTWERATNGLRNIGVRAIAVDPFQPSRVYAAGTEGVFRSDDRGRTWSEVNNGITERNIGPLVADPVVPGTLYAGVAYRYGARPGGLFRTTDGGLHWTDVAGSALAANGIVEVRALGAGSQPHTVYASIQRVSLIGASEEVFAKSDDAGETWSVVGDSQRSITGLFVDPKHATTVYADASSGLYKTTDGGATWDILAGAYFGPLALDPNATDTLYAPSAGKAALITKSENGGASWTDLAVGLRSPRVAAIATDATIPTIVYCGTFEDGVFKSTDAGTTWTPASTGLGDLRISLLTIVPWEMPVLFAVTQSMEIYRSTDRAGTWTLASRGLPIPFSVVAIDGDPSVFGTVYVVSYGAGIFKTTDFGETWTETDNGPGAPAAVRSLAVDPAYAGVIYAAGAEGVSKSTDGGATWQGASNGLLGRIGTVIEVDPLDSSVLYLSTSRREPYRGGPETIEVFDIVFRSVDGGGSWVPLNEPRLTLVDLSVTYATRSIAIDPSSGAVYMSAAVGLIRSRDRGSHWELLDEGLPPGTFTLAIAESAPPILYAARVAGDLFRLTFGGSQGLCVPSATALCLNHGRFRAEVTFNARNIGLDGDARTLPITDESGSFWFFSSQNLELIVKVVDGRAFNERFWVFFAGLSDVEYTVTVTDTATGFLRTYFNPSGRIASQADADAFLTPFSARSPAKEAALPSGAAEICASAGSSLCLNDRRFRVDVSFRTPNGSQSGIGVPVGLTSDTGYFWFFSPANIELVVKVLDGRAVNGSFWVFYAGLTDLETTITVTDTVSGASRSYVNPPGSAVSRADTSAF